MSSLRISGVSNTAMYQRHTVSLQSARCPHGAPSGTCPACMGGGGGGGASARRQPGLMTWNEAYALWRSIQYAKLQAADDQLSQQTKQHQQARELLQTILKSDILAGFTRMIQTVIPRPVIQTVQQTYRLVHQLTNMASTAIHQVVNHILQPLQQLASRFIDITDKLATILGEQKKLLLEALSDSLERLKKRLYKFRIIRALVAVMGAHEQTLIGHLMHQVDKVKKRLSQAFERLFHKTHFENYPRIVELPERLT